MILVTYFLEQSNSGSIGGVVSCNFAGSRRFKVGSVRDHHTWISRELTEKVKL